MKLVMGDNEMITEEALFSFTSLTSLKVMGDSPIIREENLTHLTNLTELELPSELIDDDSL
jgi:hypothetical protein